MAAALRLVALVVAGARGKRRGVIDRAAVAAHRTIRPDVAFEPCAGLVGILENGVVQMIGSHEAPATRLVYGGGWSGPREWPNQPPFSEELRGEVQRLLAALDCIQHKGFPT